jgi:hypothetical protein
MMLRKREASGEGRPLGKGERLSRTEANSWESSAPIGLEGRDGSR